MLDEKTKLKLLKLIDETKADEIKLSLLKVAKEILGPSSYNFVHEPEAHDLAVMPLAPLKEFIERVELIRLEFDEKYAEAVRVIGIEAKKEAS